MRWHSCWQAEGRRLRTSDSWWSSKSCFATEYRGAEGLGAIRAALARVFEKITLVRDGDELLLVPQVRAFDEIEAWARLSRTAYRRQAEAAERGPASEKTGRRTLVLSPIVAAALFEPIPL